MKPHEVDLSRFERMNPYSSDAVVRCRDSFDDQMRPEPKSFSGLVDIDAGGIALPPIDRHYHCSDDSSVLLAFWESFWVNQEHTGLLLRICYVRQSGWSLKRTVTDTVWSAKLGPKRWMWAQPFADPVIAPRLRVVETVATLAAL